MNHPWQKIQPEFCIIQSPVLYEVSFDKTGCSENKSIAQYLLLVNEAEAAVLVLPPPAHSEQQQTGSSGEFVYFSIQFLISTTDFVALSQFTGYVIFICALILAGVESEDQFLLSSEVLSCFSGDYVEYEVILVTIVSLRSDTTYADSSLAGNRKRARIYKKNIPIFMIRKKTNCVLGYSIMRILQ